VVNAPVRLDAMSLAPGRHTLEVTVLDEAGNQSSQTVTFRVVVSSGKVRKLINRLDDQGLVGPKLATKLKKQLQAAKRADRQKDAGEAVRSLKRFERLASRVKDKEVRLALKRLSRTLKSQL
jgi:arabinoxylan arabinofuranohydrolase